MDPRVAEVIAQAMEFRRARVPGGMPSGGAVFQVKVRRGYGRPQEELSHWGVFLSAEWFE